MLRRFFLALALCAGASALAQSGRVLDARAAYPEGPLWVGANLMVAEMGADRVSILDGGRKRTFFNREGCGPTAIAPYGEGFLVLCHLEGAVVAVNAEGGVRFVRDADAEGRRLRDPNDASPDGAGGVYFTDPGLFSRETRPHGALMHIDAAGHVRRLDTELWYPNGVFYDQAERALYLSETFRRRVLRYAIGADGAFGAPTVFADIDLAPAPRPRGWRAYPEAGPDGLEKDRSGALAVAIYGEGRILRFDTAGAFLGAVEIPARYVTNLAFAPDGRMAVTGAFENRTPPFPGEVRLIAAR